jgi:uncharacterized protein YaeQ
MALKATIHKAELQITDLDRHYYADHQLTIARHPSETDERMMVRLVAFALHACEGLQFSKGLSTDDEPDIWLKNYSDEIELWIELGQPDERRIRRACGRARKVVIYNYQAHSGAIWWEQLVGKLGRFDNLAVHTIDDEAVAALGRMAARSMRLQCTIQDGHLLLTDGEQSLEIVPETWKRT